MNMFPFHKNHNVDLLLLDPQNPRLPGSVGRDEESMIAYLSHHAAVEELVSSIGENGFFFAEALVAVPVDEVESKDEITDETPLIVVEGNRRLTALKVLQNGELTPRRAIRHAAESAQIRPASVPIIIYKNREAVLQFLGYRHITGVKPWDPLAKARYIKQLFEDQPSTDPFADRYREVAQMVGSKPQYVRRSLNAVSALELAKGNDFFELDLDEEEIEFSFILTAIGYSEIQNYILNNESDVTLHIIENTDQVDLKRLSELFSWMFAESRSGSTRLVESRNIKKLAAIVAAPKALERFRSGANIEQSYLATKGVGDEFAKYLRDADDSLTEASSIIAYVTYSEIVFEVSESAYRQSRHIMNSLSNLKSADEE